MDTEKSLATPKTDDRAVNNMVFVISRQTESILFDIIDNCTGVIIFDFLFVLGQLPQDRTSQV
jgi:hypothetical protein